MTGVYVEPTRSDFWQLARDANGNYLDALGPKNCQTHTASRLIMRANEGNRPAGVTGIWPPTGEAIRIYTGDNIGGTTHTQMREVALNKYATSLTVRNGISFDDFIDEVETTRGAGLSVWYKRIRDTANRRGSCTFYQNHEIFIGGVDRDRGVFTDVVDPLADGRRSGCAIYHGPGEYPISLLRMAAGDLNIASDPNDYVRLGTGLCYALFTKPTGAGPTPVVVPHVVLTGPAVKEVIPVPLNLNGLAATSDTTITLAKGQPIFLRPNGPRVTAASSQAAYRVLARVNPGWLEVKVTTKGPWSDGIARDTGLFVPANAGPIKEA